MGTPERIIDCMIGDMTCSSCELLLERKLKALEGVESVDADHRAGIVRLTLRPGMTIDEGRMKEIVEKAGYRFGTASSEESNNRKWLEIGAALIVILALYKLISAFDLVSLAPSTSGALTLGGIFLIGLVAGTSSCLAVAGGLLLAVAAKYNEAHRSQTAAEKFRPLLYFNIGRLASYFVLGGVVGLIGTAITLSPKMTGILNIVVAVMMFLLALNILHVLPKGLSFLRPPKSLSRRIAAMSENPHPAAPFLLGAGTFFLPCGFTQSLQLVALASANFYTGALIMLLFALGTLPSLLGISALSAVLKGRGSTVFLRFSGTLVLVLALFNVRSGLSLMGIDTSVRAVPPTAEGNAILKGNVQEISMRVTPYGYEPAHLTIQSGIPVRWTIDGTQASGCTSILTIPSLGISEPLRSGPNTVEFTAPAKGTLAFTCGMGMVNGTFTVL